MFRALLPRETSFFDYFERHVALTLKGCRELNSISGPGGGDFPGAWSRIKEIEHECDDITHDCVEALHRTFITPMDRGDIHRLIKRLDDIMNAVDTVVSRL